MDATGAWFIDWLTTNINRSIGFSFQRGVCVAAGKERTVICVCSGHRRGCVKCLMVWVKGLIRLSLIHRLVARSSHHPPPKKLSDGPRRWHKVDPLGANRERVWSGARGWWRVFDTAVCLTHSCRTNIEWHLDIRHKIGTYLIVWVLVSFSDKLDEI